VAAGSNPVSFELSGAFGAVVQTLTQTDWQSAGFISLQLEVLWICVFQGSMLRSKFSDIFSEKIGVFLKNQCYDQNFLPFSPKKVEFFSKTNVMIKFLQKLAAV
jgi:hypothetical protein